MATKGAKTPKTGKAASQRQAAAPKRRRRTTTRPETGSSRQILPPAFVFLVFVAVGLGTLSMGQETRQLALWGILLVGSVVLGAQRGVKRLGYSLLEIGRGVVFGLVIGFPLALALPDALATVTTRLYGEARPESLLLRLVLVAPLVEGIYFRGFLQPTTGLGLSAIVYALAGLILYLPVALGFPAVLVAIVVVGAALGLIYGVVAKQYGVASSIACQAASALLLWALPPVLRL